jgi:hypothetical protein
VSLAVSGILVIFSPKHLVGSEKVRTFAAAI